MDFAGGFFNARSDRIIAWGRTVLAAFIVAAVWIDPSQPAYLPAATYAVLLFYCLFAAFVAVVIYRRDQWIRPLPPAAHLVDIAVFTFLVFSTEGATSPFFLLFTFSIVSATFRWGWRGALWTSVAVLALLVASATAYLQFVPSAPFEADRLILRGAHITVIGAMLAYFGFHQDRMTREMSRLGEWHADPLDAPDPDQFLDMCARELAAVFRTPRLLLVVNDREEPWATAVFREDGVTRRQRLDPEAAEALSPAAIAGSSFMAAPAAGVFELLSRGRVLHFPRGAGVLAALRDDYRSEGTLSAPIRSQRFTGRLFVFDRTRPTAEDLLLAEMAAEKIGAGLERLEAVDTLRRATATEERLRFARDLHDGVLQLLSGTALQLEGVVKTMAAQPAEAVAQLRTLQEWLLGEQRELRSFIRRLRPGAPPASPAGADEGAELAPLVHSLRRQWGIEIALEQRPAGAALPQALAFDVSQLIREAVANAVRHGGASCARLSLDHGEDHLRLTVRDDGHGLSRRGEFDHRQLEQMRLGPVSLRERAAGLGGSLRAISGDGGLELRFDLPLRECCR